MPLKQSGFIGFPDGKQKAVKVPDTFFTDLLPQIDDLAELKVTLHAIWLLNTLETEVRYLRGDDLRSDDVLLRGLELEIELRSARDALEDALQRAVARQTFIRLDVEMAQDDGQGSGTQTWEDWYFLNTVKGRQAAAQIRTGKLHDIAAVVPAEARLRVERPNIFILYEQNIAMLTPISADQLRDIEKSYPPEWIAEAFDIAVAANKRSLRYIQAILKRWETEGKTSSEIHERDSVESRRRKYIPDELADYQAEERARAGHDNDPDFSIG
jgi:DnaD/phage-associated family protein